MTSVILKLRKCNSIIYNLDRNCLVENKQVIYLIGALSISYFGDLAINENVEIKRENREEEK